MTIHEILNRIFNERRLGSLFSLLTPPQVAERSPAVRLLVAGGTLTVLATALATAATATALMLLAVGVIYYLLTQVLGMKLDFDPQLFVQQARRYESAPSAPN
jgi:hypothetical protein